MVGLLTSSTIVVVGQCMDLIPGEKFTLNINVGIADATNNSGQSGGKD